MFGLSLGAIKLIVWGVIVATVLGFAAYVKHEWDAGQSARTQVAARAAQDRATAHAETVVVSSAAKTEKASQAVLAAQSVIIIKEVPVYVTTKAPAVGVPCISNGLVRLHDAAALGVDPDSLAAPGPDAACSTVAASDLADTIARNYAAARANAQQLNDLEDTVHEQAHAAGDSGGVAAPPAPLALDVPY